MGKGREFEEWARKEYRVHQLRPRGGETIPQSDAFTPCTVRKGSVALLEMLSENRRPVSQSWLGEWRSRWLETIFSAVHSGSRPKNSYRIITSEVYTADCGFDISR